MPQGRTICIQSHGAGNDRGVYEIADVDFEWKSDGAEPQEKIRRGISSTLTSFHSLHIFVVPGDDAIQAVEEMLFFMEAVGLARIND